uniref:Regulator of G-protein signaling 8 n=1 Tax=Cyclopterus lumpus TaxID=8103 RepID=A0A8C3A284_CYCLU
NPKFAFSAEALGLGKVYSTMMMMMVMMMILLYRNGCYAAYINPVFEVLFVVFTSCPYRLIHVCFPDGLAAFRTFLKSEFSDENIEFWMACEEYKKIKSSTKLVSKANKIFQEFIDIQAPREVNIDYRTREKTKQSLEDPSPTSLNEVQAKVYSLMEKDSYPRFLRSKMYQEMINRLYSSHTILRDIRYSQCSLKRKCVY